MHSASAPSGAEYIARQPARLPVSAVSLGFMSMLTVMGSRAAFAVTYPVMVAEEGWTVSEVTSAFSAGLLAFAPMAVLVGYLTDRIGCRVTMLGGTLALMAGMAVVASATELWHLYIAYILTNGVGSAAIGFVTVVKALSIKAPRRFAAAFGMAQMGQGVGALVLSPLIQGVIDVAGWRAGSLVVIPIAAVGLIPVVVAFAPGREYTSGAHTTHYEGKAPPVWSWVFASFFLANVGLGYQMLVPTHHVAHIQEAGFVPIAAALAAGSWGALSAVGGLAGGLALERLGISRVLGAAFALFAIGTAALIGSRPEVAWLLMLFIVIGGIGRGMLGTAVAAGQTAVFAGPHLGRVTGLLELAFGTGAFLGPWLAAVVHDNGQGFGPGLGSAIFMAGLAAVMTGVGSALARRPNS